MSKHHSPKATFVAGIGDLDVGRGGFRQIFREIAALKLRRHVTDIRAGTDDKRRDSDACQALRCETSRPSKIKRYEGSDTWISRSFFKLRISQSKFRRKAASSGARTHLAILFKPARVKMCPGKSSDSPTAQRMPDRGNPLPVYVSGNVRISRKGIDHTAQIPRPLP